MKIGELKEKLKDFDDDSDVALVEVGYDRYGSNIGLVVNGKNDEAILTEYFGGESPNW